MRRAIGMLGVCLAASAAAGPAGLKIGDYRGLPSDLSAAAAAYDIAQFKTDRRELERWLADDYLLVNSDGKNQTKAQAISGNLDPARKTKNVAISKEVRMVWSGGAVLGGIVDATGTDHGRPFAFHARFVDVWAKRRGRWQVVFTQINEGVR